MEVPRLHSISTIEKPYRVGTHGSKRTLFATAAARETDASSSSVTYVICSRYRRDSETPWLARPCWSVRKTINPMYFVAIVLTFWYELAKHPTDAVVILLQPLCKDKPFLKEGQGMRHGPDPCWRSSARFNSTAHQRTENNVKPSLTLKGVIP